MQPTGKDGGLPPPLIALSYEKMAGYSNPELASQWEHVTPQCEEALRTEGLGWLHQPLTNTSP